MSRKQERIAFVYSRLNALGFDYAEASQLLRIERTLHRWHELECGTDAGSIERDEATDKPYFRRQWQGMGGVWHDRKYPYPDKEKGALKRLAGIMANHPDLVSYQQGDPRGCALYILNKKDIKEGEHLNCIYSRGLSVCVD
jgi:hypothetical protein